MALVFMEGFDNYNVASRDLIAGGFTSQTNTGFSTGRFSPGKSLSFISSSSNASVVKSQFLGNAVQIITMGFAVSQKSASNAAPGPELDLYFLSNTNLGSSQAAQITFRLKTDGSFMATWNAPGSVNQATSITSLGTPNVNNYSGVWHYVEFQATCSATANSSALTVKFDGTNVLAASGIDFNILGWGGFEILVPYTGGSNTTLIDDIYFCDDQGSNNAYNDFLGICQVSTIFPNQNGTYTQFAPVPSSDSNWQAVSETSVDADTSYNTASSVGKKDTFLGGSSFSSTQTILAVQPKISVRQDDTLNRAIQTYLRSGTTEVGGNPITLTPSKYQFASDIFIQDPNTATPWTSTSVNALEFGYNITQ